MARASRCRHENSSGRRKGLGFKFRALGPSLGLCWDLGVGFPERYISGFN